MNSITIPLNKLYSSSRWNVELFLAKDCELQRSDNYQILNIGSVVSQRREFLLPMDFSEWKFNYVGLENISQGSGQLVSFSPKEGKEVKSRCKIFKRGDVLYGRLRPTLNKSLYIDEVLSEGICSNEIFVLIPNVEIIDPSYFQEIILSRVVRDRVGSLTAGASLPRIQIQEFFNLQIPVPELSVQKKLVQKLNEYSIKVEKLEKQVNVIKGTLSDQLLDSVEEGREFELNLKDLEKKVLYKNPLP